MAAKRSSICRKSPSLNQTWIGRLATEIGAPALASLLSRDGLAAGNQPPANAVRGVLPRTHHPTKAKHVIRIHQGGAPSHIDLFDYKPALKKHHGEELPDSVRNGQRITGMTSGQKAFPCVAPMFEFRRHGKSGLWLSELLPHTGAVADDICVIKSMTTEAINHDPAITYIQTASRHPGASDHRLMALLRAGHGDGQPPRLRRADLPGQHGNDSEASGRLTSVGESPRNERLDVAEHAAWSSVAGVLLNLDEVITKN